MNELIEKLTEMIHEIIAEAGDEPQFTTWEHATIGAEEICYDLLIPMFAEVWDEGFADGVNHDLGDRENAPSIINNPYRKEQTDD